MTNVPEIFGSLIFNDATMRRCLPKDTYKELKRLIDCDEPLTLAIANIVAHEMKEWAIGKGATHYTHWFQPMTGITAEKHDSFITPQSDGTVLMNFSGKELIKGESDASSFPSGGLRSTFEARGYTAWDPTSPAFVKDGVLCIPTAFCAYNGQTLDKKTPLLRSTKALNDQAVRLMRCLGKDVRRVTTTVGAEQEYFLLDKTLYNKRKDLIFCGRTLFGSKPPKGQELDDHYFGNIKARVLAYMSDLDNELWKVGVLAKTRHNEAAPSQHELAPIYCAANIAADDNQITMEFMKKVASKHNMVCLLHEKPFAGVNGSGKHNNWAMMTDKGENLLEPGKTPHENIPFLLILTAVIAAVDKHQDLLRLSVSNAGNDHRLGANEAPPAILSMYLGDELTAVMESIAADTAYNNKARGKMNLATNIPEFMRDTSDRNRTSPFAFTGNKFEFRMLGSTSNICCPNAMINTAVAETLDEFATKLEKSKSVEKDALTLIRETYIAHRRIIFNGNGYSKEWEEEAARRGLLNLKTTPDALVYYTKPKNVKLLGKYGVYSAEELAARQEILLENYAKLIHIEAQTMLEMFAEEILPGVIRCMHMLASTVTAKAAAGVTALTETDLLKKITAHIDCAYAQHAALERCIASAKAIADAEKAAMTYRNTVIPAMDGLRTSCDALEQLVGKEFWPFPTYSELLFSL